MAQKTPFQKIYANKKGRFSTAKDGYNKRIRYFYCKSCGGCQIRRTGEVKPKACDVCEHKKLQYIGSQVEARRYAGLILLERMGDITELRCQVKFPLDINGEHICNYNADFVYTDHHGKEIIEDAKPKVWRDEIYLMKKKLMKACLNLEIREVN